MLRSSTIEEDPAQLIKAELFAIQELRFGMKTPLELKLYVLPQTLREMYADHISLPQQGEHTIRVVLFSKVKIIRQATTNRGL